MIKFPITERENDNFDCAIICYLEKVAQVENLAVFLLRILSKWKKPSVLTLEQFRP